MSCKLWSKVTSVFLNINFCAKMSILGKNNWSSVRNVDFLKLLCTTIESEYLIGKHAYIQNILTFCVNVFIHQNVIKTSIFLRKCLFVHVLIFISISFVGKLLFWFKIWFYSVIFWKKCHFPSKIYISGSINVLEKSSNFLRKGVNLAVNFGKNDNWY